MFHHFQIQVQVWNIYFFIKILNESFFRLSSIDILRNLSSVPFCAPLLVRRKIFYLNLLNSKRKSRFLQKNNSHKKPRSKLTKPLLYPTLSKSKNELNLSLLNSGSLNNKSLPIFILLTSSSIDFSGLTERDSMKMPLHRLYLLLLLHFTPLMN